MKLVSTHVIAFIGCLLLSNYSAMAQAAIPVATNNNVTTTIFFPSNIVRVVPPAINYKFQHEADSNIGLLKGRTGKPSNLTVITEAGRVFSFALRYSEQVEKFNYILTADQAIGQTKGGNALPNATSKQPTTATQPAEVVKNPANSPKKNELAENKPDTQIVDVKKEKNSAVTETKKTAVVEKPKPKPEIASIPDAPVAETTKGVGEGDLYDVDREEYYKIYCENNYLQKTIFQRSFRQNKRISLRLNNILVDRKEKYFVLQIENNSKKEYDVAGLSFFKKTGIGQLEKIMNPVYSFNLQETIDPESINEVVYVFKNFNLTNKESVVAVLADLNSDNMVILPIDRIIINSASN